ncbi:MAG TPA: adenylate/guanylate cyclase domain-containing protein [Solirubrobacteraceae bacterium]|jgi:class 3 adenylate cyclase|nr:adenylate/guanylate cyclase domain-containing protein [Solirubrobacteraceae bacterium]
MGETRSMDVQTELSLLEASMAGGEVTWVPVQRTLATVLFTDIVDSTRHAVSLGDTAWREVLDRHDTISRGAVAHWGGRVIKGTGDGMLARFDAPVGALRCAKALRVALEHAGIEIRAGIHTGEVELRGDDIAGIGVHIAARITALASAGELLASRTVKDLVAGSEHRFTSRGIHGLRGVPERWELHAVS